VFRARTAAVAASAVALALAASACAPKSTAKPATSAAATSAGASAAATTSAACAPASLALYKGGQLTVATDSPAYDPWFSGNDPANGKGFESAVAYAVAGKLGFDKTQVKWVIEPFDNSYAPGAKNFDFDVNEISITAERAKTVDFSDGYYTAAQAVLTLKDGKYAAVTSLAALKDAKLGVQVATTSYQAVTQQIKPSQKPNVYNTTDDEVNALKNHQVDAVVTDTPTVFYLAGAELDNGKIVGQFSYSGGSSDEQFGLLLPKGSKLTSCVDQAVAALKADGTLKQITDQWLSSSANVPYLQP
jgi:polar amino acid transport system substrate-binding protein